MKPSCQHTVDLPALEACTLVWEARVTGCKVSYRAGFVPSAEDRCRTVTVQKSKTVTKNDKSVIGWRFKCSVAGKVVLLFYNHSSKKNKLLYKFKKVASE